jgi:hypothetical protein
MKLVWGILLALLALAAVVMAVHENIKATNLAQCARLPNLFATQSCMVAQGYTVKTQRTGFMGSLRIVKPQPPQPCSEADYRTKTACYGTTW